MERGGRRCWEIAPEPLGGRCGGEELKSVFLGAVDLLALPQAHQEVNETVNDHS